MDLGIEFFKQCGQRRWAGKSQEAKNAQMVKARAARWPTVKCQQCGNQTPRKRAVEFSKHRFRCRDCDRKTLKPRRKADNAGGTPGGAMANVRVGGVVRQPSRNPNE